MLEDEKDDHEPRRAPFRRRRWQIGMFLFLISNIVGSSIQITTLPLPLLSTLQASGLVFNALLATLLLREPFTIRTAFGTLLVAAGAVLISLYSALPEPSHNLDQLLDLLVVRGFVLWMSMTLLLVVIILAGTFFLQYAVPPHQRQRPRMRLLRGMSYGLVSGVLSAHSLLLAKSAVELLVRTVVDKKNQFNRAPSWILLLLFLFLALTQLYYLHRGLKLVTTSILYPFVFCVYNIIAILDGLIYFRQMDRLPPLHAALIAVGTVILLAGVLALSWRLSEEDASSLPNGHAKTDIPPSALAPGMGFVDDSTSGDDYDAADASEAQPLMRRHTLRDSALMPAKKRRRRSTIREAASIWDELCDEDRYYGSMNNGDVRHSRGSRQSLHVLRESNELGESDVKTGIPRSKTAPPDNKPDRRRSEPLQYTHPPTTQSRDSLTQSLVDWWRTRWNKNQQEPHLPESRS
ncbi:hypothetical protein MBLNU459_g2932t1 [Dothideomycetes sp. NU459]